MKWSKYNCQWCSEEDYLITYNSLNNTIISARKEEFENMLEEDYKQLREEGFIVDDSIDESALMESYIQRRNKETKSLSCWVFVSNDCNLACSYCWEKGGLLKSNSNMNEATYKKAVAWIISKVNKKSMESLAITFMGGEPLLNIKAIEYVALQLGNISIPVTFNVITNGVLLEAEMVKKLARLNIHSYQITLDGTVAIHNSRRHYRDGRGTFDKIVHNIAMLIDEDPDASIVIRINVDKDNYKSVPYLLKLLKSLQYSQFASLCVNDTILEDDSENEFILKEIVKILQFAQKLGFHIAYGELNNCWMMSESWYMINMDGLLYKCPSMVGNKDYAVGSIDLKEMYDTYYVQIAKTPWKECLNCELVGLCSGGCPNRELIAKGAGHCKKVCRKAYMKELLKLKYNFKIEEEGVYDEDTLE
ncbi:radical SAM/SPASM domain-containing protein [Cellulosilyticum ruminicola]|uniref:radical SAM/SPASM domain-containing protein n=1 Tax=Cellulosilyticum ruminicola TaxID=425254 RepID=UPI00155DAB15|nr:radical SAM protein [Cellulosilyticum ruminicola]